MAKTMLSDLARTMVRPIRHLQYVWWRLNHPSAPFTDYFAKIARSDLNAGRSHPSLGSAPFGAGKNAFNKLVETYGLVPADTCVDYGCGTLRIGAHAIRYLSQGRFWGLDIDQFLLDQGIELCGEDLIEEKRPHLKVISDSSVREAAAAKPKLVYSFKVIPHVHPDELKKFFENILTIIGADGTAAVSGKWHRGKTIKAARQSWLHSEEDISRLVRLLGGDLQLKPKKFRKGEIHGILRVNVR
jgi:hypothetical protein